VIRKRPKKTMWQLIAENYMPPTMIARYCCEYLKEQEGEGRWILTGIRAEESAKRKRRSMTEVCKKDRSANFLHPIIDWTEKDVWEFIKTNKFAYPDLYDKGWKRLGCIGCPMSSRQAWEFEQYPRFRKLYIKAFERMLVNCEKKNHPWKSSEKTGEGVMAWWITKKSQLPVDDGQCELFGFGEVE
jgi:phosphoadenosine phosphosulfate reductase